MIVSHSHKFIFTAIPKTGTHAIRRALREHMSPDDLEQVGLFVQRRMPFPEIAALQHGHISLAQIRPALGEAAFGAYLKCAFVRNPFDRFVSYCAFVTREDKAFERNPQDVMRYFLFKDVPMDHLLFRPQFEFVSDASGQLLADDVGRVEDMQGSYDRLCARIGIPTSKLEKVNSTSRKDYRSYYAPELVDAVARLYKRDLDLFGYRFEEG